LTLELAEEGIRFPGPAGLLEGRLASPSSKFHHALIALHPHSLYGGTMDNNVVEAAVRAGQASGFMTLRFNFRGVMGSEGAFDDGIGEQNDLGAAIAFLQESLAVQTTVVVGYSFGASVGLAYAHRTGHGINHLVLIAPPPFLLSDELSLELPVIEKIFVGEQDEIAPLNFIRSRMSKDGQRRLMTVIPGTNHFFGGHEKKLETSLMALFHGFRMAKISQPPKPVP
jgi:alpha/beta superfamily hydrolase